MWDKRIKENRLEKEGRLGSESYGTIGNRNSECVRAREKEGERDRCIACRLVNLQFTTDSRLPEAVQPASQPAVC